MGSQVPGFNPAYILEHLRSYQVKANLSNAQLATDMTAFGWTWNENNVELLLKGKLTLSDREKEFVKNYLLQKLYETATIT